jgi:hypothetical protein
LKCFPFCRILIELPKVGGIQRNWNLPKALSFDLRKMAIVVVSAGVLISLFCCLSCYFAEVCQSGYYLCLRKRKGVVVK